MIVRAKLMMTARPMALPYSLDGSKKSLRGATSGATVVRGLETPYATYGAASNCDIRFTSAVRNPARTPPLIGGRNAPACD